jgi:PKD repeat protein
VEVKTDFAGGDNSKIMKNIAGENFDIGYNFENNPIKSSTIAQLKVKFLQKGTYTVSLSSINAFSRDRKQIEISSNAADIEIFDVPAPGTAETPRGEIQNEGDSERAQADKEKERDRQLMRE